MKIVSVHNFYQQPGGEDAVWRNEAALLHSKGHQVVKFVRRNSEIADQSLLASARLAVRAVWSRESMHALMDTLVRETPDVVHFHNTFPLISPSAYYACLELGIPVVQTLHNYRLVCPAATFFRDGGICEQCAKRSLSRSILHACYRGSRAATATTAAMLTVHRMLNTWRDAVDCFIVPTQFCRAKFSAAGVPLRKIVVKPNFLSADPGCRTGVGDYAIFVGRLAREKGIAALIAAWRGLGPKCSLRILGDGPLRPEMERAAASLDSGIVKFEGWADHDSVIAAIQGARVLIFPSEWYETFGLVAVEAFACGVPVIASRLGVMREIVDDGRTGLHFTPGDPADLAAKVLWACDHPRELELMGRNARAEYEAKYTAERNYRQLVAIYERVISAAGVESRSVPFNQGGQDAVQHYPEARFS